MRSPALKALRIVGAWATLAAILACSFNTNDDTPPSPRSTGTTPAPSPSPAPAPAPVAEPTPPPQPQAPTPPPDPGAVPPTAGPAVQLSAGFLPDPQTARGQAGGPVQGSALANNESGCTGWVPAAPQHTLMLQTAFRSLRIVVSAGEDDDTTLIVRGPDGRYYCNDDTDGFNPVVAEGFGPGTYQVWVGTYSQGSTASYVIGFTEYPHVDAASLAGQ